MSTSIFDAPAFTDTLFFPRPDATPPPPGARDLHLDVAEGVTLHARWHAAPAARATILLFHGNGEVVADYDAAAPRFHAAGADLVAVDFRGYGQSTGAPTYRNSLTDAHAILPALRAALGATLPARPLVAFGRSLGGACAADLAGATPPVLDALVLESAGADLRTLLARRGLPKAPITDDDRRAFDVGPKLARCHLPTLVLHGAADQIIDPTEADANLASLASTRKRLVRVPGRGHNDLAASPVYWAALASFIGELAPGSADRP